MEHIYVKTYRKITKKKTIQLWTEKQVEKHFFINIKIKKIILWFRICSITRTHQYIWVIAWCTELYERTRSPWRKTKVWQFWVLIWAEATLCTDLQPPRWSPQSEIVFNTELSGSCCRRLAPLLLSSSLRAGGKKTIRVGLQVCIVDFASGAVRLPCLLWTLIVLTYLLWTGFESKASVDKEEAVRHRWTLDSGEQEIMNWWCNKRMPTVCSNHSQKCVKITDWSVVAFAKFYKKNPKGTNVRHAFLLYVIKMVWKLRRRDLQKAHLMVPLLPDLLRQKCQQICFCHPPGPFFYPKIFAKSAQDWKWFFLHQRAPEQRECRGRRDRFALLQGGRGRQVTLNFDFFVITCQWFKLLKRCGL